MGAWGYRSFDNDSAFDWLGDLENEDASVVDETLALVANEAADEYLDVDAACAALAAAELVAAAHGKGTDRLCDEAAAWLEEHRSDLDASSIVLARAAVERVLLASELRDLWAESESHAEWQRDVNELIARLRE